MTSTPSLHSICRWTFNAGKGGFVPGDIRPSWGADQFTSVDFVHIVRDEIAPRMPEHVLLGVELHYDSEYDEDNVEDIADALVESDLYLAMATPGAHTHFGYGGITSLDPDERRAAETFGNRALDLIYGPLRKAWHPAYLPSIVIWNGSFGYDLASVGIRQMYRNMLESLARLCRYEEEKGGELFITLEPKPNEGHPAMLLPTVASAIVCWYRMHEEHGIPLERKGINKEIGHSEMIGLDAIIDTVEELESGMMHHTHLNSQGYNDGIILGGPGRYDIDHGTRITGMNIAMARLMQDAGFDRWKGHDMQPRPYDDEEQAIDRVVRSVLSWEACERAAADMDVDTLMDLLAQRETAQAEDLVRASVAAAQQHFDAMYDRARHVQV